MRKLLFIFLLAALILPACAAAPTTTPTEAARATHTPRPERPTPSEAELVLSDPTKPIEVTAGDEFTITLRTTLDPERHWELAEALDTTIVDYVWKDHKSDDPGDPKSSGLDIWRFKAVAPGNATIILGYYKGMDATTPYKLNFNVVVK